MTTIQLDLPSIPTFDMADDNMEVSYDYEHGDDEIDINIDIDQHHDEDFILDDVRSEADATADDPMVDDDNASIPMVDADFLEDQDLVDFPIEAEHNSEIQMIQVDATELAKPYSSHADINAPLEVHPEAVWTFPQDSGGALEFAKNDEASQLQDENGTLADEPSLTETSPARTSEQPRAEDAEEVVQDSVSTVPDSTNENVNATQATAASSPYATADLDNVHDKTQEQHVEHDTTTTENRKTIVSYKDAEYSLISSSEDDDPDTFFLNDASLISAPLPRFFAALREVLHEDLTSDDELFLIIDDLGLETCETCKSNEDVTFYQILDLHTRLAQNDGVGIVPPLYITLGMKPEFCRSFGTLLAGANQGKGLSEVVTHEEDYFDSPEGHEELETLEEDGNYEAESREEADPNDEAKAYDPNDLETVENSGEVFPQQDFTVAVAAEGEKSDAKTNGDQNGSGKSEDQTHEVPVEVEHASSRPKRVQERRLKSANAATPARSDVDEDGDLIDYSEDEDYVEKDSVALDVKRTVPNGSQGSAEYEAINESLSRRSSSRTIENGHLLKALEDSASATSMPTPSTNASLEEEHVIDSQGEQALDADNNENGGRDFDAKEEYGKEDHNDEHFLGESYADNNDFNIDLNDEDGGEKDVQNDGIAHADHRQNRPLREGKEAEIEYENGDELDGEYGQQDQGPAEDELNFEEITDPETNGGDSSYLADDSAPVLLANSQEQGKDDEDEIGYEDDDELVDEVTIEASVDKKLPLPVANKRAHGEVNGSFDDVNQQPKRVRP